MVGGALVVNDDGAGRAADASTRTPSAAMAGPFDAWLVLRGLRTLAVRMERHCDNAEQVAAFLAEHRAVDRGVLPGPGLTTRP